ncbi:AI-2E family transporter [Pseudomonas knackmussii]|uniref:AI-2E family transporter n=1 Tax=Pseudomonas knackmussii TaxID=65741 RepID=UPI003F4A5AC4
MLPPADRLQSRNLLDVLIRAGLILLLAVFCYRIFHPFLDLMLWALILAVTLYPLQLLLQRLLGQRAVLASSLLALFGLALLLVPVVMIGFSIAESVTDLVHRFQAGDLHVPTPPEGVADWPLVGPYVFSAWQRVAQDFLGVAQQAAPHLQGVAKVLLGKVAGVGVELMQFLGAFLVACVIMVYGPLGTKTAEDIATRISGPERGPELAALCTSTIRAVAQGVVGVAFIQTLLLGLGFIVMGIPGAGLLSLGVLLLGIVQMPVALVSLPAVGYVFWSGDYGTVSAVIFTIWTVLAGLSDNVLKPLMLGRGVAVPMPMILIGALGGMITGGIIGLFIGPVFLALGFQLFMAWVRDRAPATEPGTSQ